MSISQLNPRFQRGLLLCIILSLCVTLASWLTHFKNSSTLDSVQSSELRSAPSFELKDIHNRKHSLSDLHGKWVILHFWASWCPPCLEEISRWLELGTTMKERPVQLIAVSLDQKWQDAEKILPSKNLGTNVLSLLDLDGKVPDSYGSFQFPETYLISPDHKIVMKWVGPQEWDGPEMKATIEKMVSK